MENTVAKRRARCRGRFSSRTKRYDDAMNIACSNRATSATMPKARRPSASSGRWNATTSIQGDTTYITSVLRAAEPRSSSSFAFPSTKPTTISRYSVMICWPTVRNDWSIGHTSPQRIRIPTQSITNPPAVKRNCCLAAENGV